LREFVKTEIVEQLWCNGMKCKVDNDVAYNQKPENKTRELMPRTVNCNKQQNQ
jgi:hypothetical protein